MVIDGDERAWMAGKPDRQHSQVGLAPVATTNTGRGRLRPGISYQPCLAFRYITFRLNASEPQVPIGSGGFCWGGRMDMGLCRTRPLPRRCVRLSQHRLDQAALTN